MIIDLSRLASNFDDKIIIDESLELDKEYLESTEIIRLSKIKVTGTITKNEALVYNLTLNIKGTMVLPCSITLQEVDYPYDIQINEVLSENKEDSEEYLKITGNQLDIIPIIWQNIVMEIPLKVTSPDAYKATYSGDGWKLITDENELNDRTDPRLDKLKDLLEEKED